MNNTSSGGGGPVRADGAVKVVASDSAIFFGNIAAYGGGAISGYDVECQNCHFESNSAMLQGNGIASGGAIQCSDDLLLNNTKFINNYSQVTGGAIAVPNYAATLNIMNSVFVDNHSDQLGGAVYVGDASRSPEFYLLNVTFQGNTAGTDGGESFHRNFYLTV